MNHPVDVHPEDLLDHERSGELTEAERARLDSHTAQCAPCALVRAATRDFESERRSAPGDAALSARISLVAMKSAPSLAGPASGHRSSFSLSRPRRARRAWAFAAVLLFAATGATASFWSVRHLLVSRLLVTTPSQAPAQVSDSREAVATKPATPPRIEFAAPPVEIAPVAPPPKVSSPTPLALPATPPAPPSRAKAPEEAAPLSADLVFSAANEARRRGDSMQAVKLYRQLQQQFPGTREETMSRVALGTLLQDRGEDPAQSLALFTRYLAESPNGTLAEEARLGRARALMRLGRAQEERQAWQELLSSHPKSIHAERARKRLEELR